MQESLYARAGAAFTSAEGVAVDDDFGASLTAASVDDTPRLLAQRLGFAISVSPSGAVRLAQSVPARAAVLLELFVEGANLGKEYKLDARQTVHLLSLLDKVLLVAAPGSEDLSLAAAIAAWDAGLAAVSADKEALGEEAGEADGASKIFSAATRIKLDGWIKDLGPLQPRHWAMLVSALTREDSRARAPVQVRLPVEIPMPMPALAGAQLAAQ